LLGGKVFQRTGRSIAGRVQKPAGEPSKESQKKAGGGKNDRDPELCVKGRGEKVVRVLNMGRWRYGKNAMPSIEGMTREPSQCRRGPG